MRRTHYLLLPCSIIEVCPILVTQSFQRLAGLRELQIEGDPAGRPYLLIECLLLKSPVEPYHLPASQRMSSLGVVF